jgi:hypothetical protein
VRDDGTSTLGVAGRPYVLATHMRRAGTLPVYTHSLFVVPDVDLAAPLTRTMVVISTEVAPRRVDASTLLPPSARGPPIA